MTISNKTVGPATYMARVAELLGYQQDPAITLAAYGQGITADQHVAHQRDPGPTDEPVLLRPCNHGPIGSIPCLAGKYLDTAKVRVELERLGIPYVIQL
jgi:hypothetical protein